MLRPALHRSSMFVAGLASIAMVLLEGPGLIRDQSLASIPSFYDSGDTFDHGWPLTYLVRYVPPQVLLQHGKPTPGAPWLSAENWAWRHARDHALSPAAFALDLCVAVAIIGLATAAWEARRRRRANAWQLRLSEFLVVVAVAAGALGWSAYQHIQWIREQRHIQALNDAAFADPPGPMFWTVGEPNVPQWVIRFVGARRLPKHMWRCVMVHATCNFDGGYNGFADAVTHLQQLRRLRVMTMESLEPPQNLPLDELAKITQIRSLDLESISVDADAPLNWRLRPADIKKLRGLDRLTLPSQSVLDEEAKCALREHLPHCQLIFADEL